VLAVAAVHGRLAARGDGDPEGHLRAARAAEERARRVEELATEDNGPSRRHALAGSTDVYGVG
jgi:hypothetical protein